MLFNSSILNKFVIISLFCAGCIGLISGQQTSKENERINAILDKIEKENKIVGELTENELTNLPVGIKKTISNHTIIIGIDSARITPQGMIVNAYTRILFPGQTEYIMFALRNAIITTSGLSQAGPTRLEMISNFRIRLNDQVTLSLPADGSNFIDWDCYGFRSVNLSGLFEFSSATFIPDDPKGSDIVTAQFAVNTTDLNNIMVATSITPFRIKGLGDMAFRVREAVVDMSDFVNCPGFAMPDDYKMIFPDAPQLWRGFFLKEVSVRLPSELKGSGKPPEIEARDLLIDEFGISGRFSATNILQLGNTSGWPFSIKSLEIGLVKNKLAAGEMAGIIGVPFLGNEPLDYIAQIVSGRECMDYSFTVKSAPEKEFPVPFGGTVKLGKGCIFSMKTVNGRFMPSAVLNGSLYIKADPADIEGLRFERLHLIAESPYIKGGVFDASSGIDCSLAGFGLSIDSISLAFRGGKAALAMNTKISLMNKSDKGVSASTRFILNASVKKEPGTDQLKWNYDGILLEGVKIRGNASLFYLSGDIAMFNDHPVYGDAFIGKVGFTAGKLIRDTVSAEVTFGKKDDFRYWFASVNVPTKLPIGMVTLTHIGGGAYSNMVRANLNDVNSEYVPSRDAGLGFLAETGLYVKTEKVFNAEALFEIAINKTGGLRYIRFTGEGKFFTAPDKGDNNFMKTTALVNMVYDNTNDCFHANLSVFMNIANALRGTGPQDLLGEAVIHVDPQDWYVYIGRPSSPLGVTVLGLFKAQTYFMAGTRIEQMPLPPSEVSSIITNINTDFMQNERGVASGRGIAFGVMFKASAGVGKEKGFVYAYFNAGAGADIMLQDYGEARCEGRSGPIGINGWYASGQGYAYLTGKIGIRVKSAEFDIMNVAAALLVQAKMPNPSWFRGSIAARYSVLGGLVKGKVNVTVVLGEECVIVTNGNELGALNLIGDISPADRSTDVDVFAAPQVSFNTTVDKEFGMVNISDEYAVYRVKLDEYKLVSGNREIKGTIQWNQARDMATFSLADILPGRQDITASVKVHVEKKTSSGWQALEANPEVKSSVFSTGDEPKTIGPGNVSYSYPLKNQYNFHKAEYPSGYIKLKYGQPKLFAPESDGIQWNYVASFRYGNKSLESQLTYSESDALLSFGIPAGLSNETVYELHIMKRPVRSGTADVNLRRSDVMLSAPNAQDTIKVASTEITGTDVSSAETDLYSFSFRTSLYPTFKQKLQSIQNWKNLFGVDDRSAERTFMSLLSLRGTVNESFDVYEIQGDGEIKPLVYLEASRTNNWTESHAWPLIYELYGTSSIMLSRNTEALGLFPGRAVFLTNMTTGNYILDGTTAISKTDDIKIKFSVPLYVKKDFSDLLDQAVAAYVNKPVVPPTQVRRLLAGYLSDIYRGQYPFTVSYRLPGIEKITSSSNYSFTY